MASILWSEPVWQVLRQLPEREQALILDKLDLLQSFPEMWPVRDTGPRVFRGHRHFLAGNRQVYYKHVNGTIYVRALWPARMPYR
jgi:hypothetical protein